MMKHSVLLCLGILFGGVCACQKIDLTEETSSGHAKQPDEGENIVFPPDGDSCLSVAQLSTVKDYEMVAVGGYIVGFVPNGSISNTVFSATGAVETNLVIADRADETDYKKCAPAQLLKGTSVRDELNLARHPDYLGQFIVLWGSKNKYYNASGIKPVKNYTFADPVLPSDSTQLPQPPSPLTYPILGNQPARVFEGR